MEILDKLKKKTEEYHLIDDISKDTHRRDIVDARRHFTLLALKYTSLPFGVIASKVGRDNASAHHYKRTGKIICEVDRRFKSNLENLEKMCQEFLPEPVTDRRKHNVKK